MVQNNTVEFGLTIWMLFRAGAFPGNFELYCGKVDKRKSQSGTHVMNTMLELPSHVHYQDVLLETSFTNHKFLSELTKKNIRACGTLRDGQSVCYPLKSNKLF